MQLQVNYYLAKRRLQGVAADTFTKPLDPFWYREHDEVLHVVPYDLDTETLILPSQSLLNEDIQLVAQSV